MDALMRILAPEIEEEKRNSIMEIVKKMINRGSDNEFITYVTSIPENEIEAMRSSMTV